MVGYCDLDRAETVCVFGYGIGAFGLIVSVALKVTFMLTSVVVMESGATEYGVNWAMFLFSLALLVGAAGHYESKKIIREIDSVKGRHSSS